ncbi:putative membrane protein YedE/YeeE [Silvimonas terrae]|uniref:Putative membrane protein YedE/YeeE n=1 Tax=Silvimonas terrae TaxID=300266 RepID=A0A840RE30_9NEIS|nr:hypothetical protein [Silvimonas terrae]MBB5191759.1 putative membrane protein YedE/YeeE [Silvimonas terrae]
MNKLTLLAMAMAAGISSILALRGSLYLSIGFLAGVGVIAFSRLWWLDHKPV